MLGGLTMPGRYTRELEVLETCKHFAYTTDAAHIGSVRSEGLRSDELRGLGALG